MNSKILISSLVLSSILFISCKKELEPQENTPTSELVKLGLMKDTTKVNSVVQTQPATNPNTVLSSNAGLNPAHGQPGHRCDIAVGAPLNSAPTQGQTTTTQPTQSVQVNAPQQNVVTTTTTIAAPVKVGKGMNPSHGQPGHRCDIPVGAPLNSPVAAKQTAAAPQGGSSSQTFTVTPPANNNVPALLSTETPTVAEGMNPAHGQPGHRCDIPVGAALPKS
ncbi:hypothetical protein IRZ71_01590 [Flavobacterium sp. ANB]|uniref:hypothetical protein n=1 Tax=unclassified Flavobacterium TaxID=196869 RepID=UPI0012B98299|nr:MULTISPECIES: hypothetical protein [unclassified Flavobacterium]MBF4515011.1 hypothetical protein [Flavobacterium sp. ANB]MTD68337.1 hypothetical protein [Flavobacterium sp. LC2016-13]